MKPSTCSMYSCSRISPCRNTALASRCLPCIFLEAATLWSIHIVVTRGTKVSLKSSPYFCRNTFVTSLALECSTSLLVFLVQCEHPLVPYGFLAWWYSSLVSINVSFLCSASVSSFLHLVASATGICSLSFQFAGSFICINCVVEQVRSWYVFVR